MILLASSVVTMDPHLPAASAVGVHDGRIIAVGTLAQCQAALPSAPVIDLGPDTLMPGFIEPHGHPVHSGLSCQPPAYYVAPWLEPTWERVVAVAARAVREVPPDRGIMLFGLDQLLHGVEFPDVAVMDDLFGDRLAAIVALSQHRAAVTSATLRALGWLAAPPSDPTGGTFGRRRDGSLNGIADEVPAILELIKPVLNSLGGDPRAQTASYLDHMSASGITTTSDMSFTHDLLPIYQDVCARPDMPMRVQAYHATNDPGCEDDLDTRLPKAMLAKGGLKFWADGSPWLGTIATSFPYLDTAAVRRAGITDLLPKEKALNYNRDQLDAMLAAHAASGWQIACHANGDLTIDLVLDCFEDALRAHGLLGTDHRWRLEHVGAVRPDQLQRMAALGVVPTFGLFQMMQWGDLLDGELYAPEFGARWSPVGDAASVNLDQLHQSYHNDGNISPPNPLASVQAAVTRRANRATEDGGYELARGNLHGPEQQVSLHVALRAITINAAYILRREHELGSITAGKWADFTQLSANPYEVDPTQLTDQVSVRRTWLAGRPTS